MRPVMEIDTKELQAALQLYSKATRKDEVEIVHRALKYTIIGSRGLLKLTPKADPGKIKAKLASERNGPPAMVIKIAAQQLKGYKGRLGSADYTKGGKLRAGSQWNRQVKDLARKISRSRPASAGYLRAGWQEAGKRAGVLNYGSPKKFKGKLGAGKAPVNRGSRPIFGEITNLVSYAAKPQVGAIPVLQAAVNAQAKDMTNHAQKVMSKTARKYSGRRR